jgi:peptidoglycan/xylan/chitin deacetylase (PgdA/CDA1 family)
LFLDYPLRGDSLPAGTLSLTFDDGPGETAGVGPGPRTLDIARFLAGQGIRATFFLAGVHAERYPHLPAEIAALGHLLANHAYHHLDLEDLAAAGGDVAGEVLRTDTLIRPHLKDARGMAFFRAPYGAWSRMLARTLNADCTAALAALGPIDWDVDGGDWRCWRDGLSPEACAGRYLREVERVGRGIVVMHDSVVDDPVARQGNHTLRLLEILIPRLRAAAYRFVGLDAIPTIRTVAGATTVITLTAADGRPLVAEEGGTGRLMAGGSGGNGGNGGNGAERLAVECLTAGRVALRAANGRPLTLAGGDGEEGAAARDSDRPGLEIVPLGPGWLGLRTADGRYLTCAGRPGVPLAATATVLDPSCRFGFRLAGLPGLSATARLRAIWYGEKRRLARRWTRWRAAGRPV